MKRLLIALLSIAVVLWILPTAGEYPAGSVSSNPSEVTGAKEGMAAGDLDSVEADGVAPVDLARARTAVQGGTVPVSLEPAGEMAARTLRFVVEAPGGEIADTRVRLVMETPGNRSIDRPSLRGASALLFVLDPLSVGDWQVVGEGVGEFGDVLELPRPEGVRTRMRLEARCGILASFESTDLEPVPEPHVLRPEIAGEVRFRLVDGGGVDLAVLTGSTLGFSVSPGTGFRSTEGKKGPVVLHFGDSLSASVWGVASGARVMPGASQITAADGSKVQVLWSGTVLGELPHGEIQVEVVPLRRAEVRVVEDATGEPIAWGRAALESTRGGQSEWFYPGDDGIVTIDSPAGFRGTLKILADGFAPLNAALPAPGEAGPHTYRLAAAARIHGAVVDRDGSPVPGVELFAGLLARSGRHATTDALGRFWFPRPVGERLEVRLVSAGPTFGERVLRGEAGRAALLVPAHYGRDEQDIVVTIVASVNVSGRAVDGAGEPLARGKVLATLKAPLGGGAPVPKVEVVKVRRGAFEFEHLVPGRWQFALWHGDVPCVQPPVEVLEDSEFDLQFVEQGSELTGQIVDEEGQPHPFSILLEGASGTRWVRSDATGRYRFGGLGAGRYSLFASSNDGSPGILTPSYLCLAECVIPAGDGAYSADYVAVRAVEVAVTVRLGTGDLSGGYRADAIEAASGAQLRSRSSGTLGTTFLHVPVGSPVILRLLDVDGKVVRQERRSFEAGARPIVDLRPR